MDWEGLQVEAFRFLTPGDLSSNFEQTVNVDAEGQGAEIELLAAVTDNFTLGGSIGYLDTEITDEPPCDVDPAMGTCIQITGGFNVTAIGLEMPKAPELTANAFGEYRWDIGSNEAWLRAEYIHRDSQYSDIEALTNLQTRGPSPNASIIRTDPQSGSGRRAGRVPVQGAVVRRGQPAWRVRVGTRVYHAVCGECPRRGVLHRHAGNFGLSGIRLRPHPRTYGAQIGYRF